MNTIGLDIGGTSIKGVYVDSNYRLLKRIIMRTLANKSSKETLANIIKAAKMLRTNKASPIGISIAGRIDKKGKVIFNPNIPHLKGTNLKKALEKELKTAVCIENDAACFAIAENRIGAGKGAENMIGLTIGTGIGSGIIINGDLYRGKGTAGELGHMTIDPSGIKCGCGKKGDLESWCSGKNIVKRYINAGGKIKNPDPKKIYFSNERIAIQIMDETIAHLGIGLSNIIAIFDPDSIIIGGGVSNLPVIDRVIKATIQNLYGGQELKTKIRKGTIELAGAVGAAMIAYRPAHFKKGA